jgi:hypothetical protein
VKYVERNNHSIITTKRALRRKRVVFQPSMKTISAYYPKVNLSKKALVSEQPWERPEF